MLSLKDVWAKKKTYLEVLYENKEMLLKQMDKVKSPSSRAKIIVWINRLDHKIKQEFDRAS